MKPAIAALSVLIFTFIWNDYFWAIVLTQGPDTQPVTAGITAFNSQYRAAYHMMSAGSIVAAIPPVFQIRDTNDLKNQSFFGLLGLLEEQVQQTNLPIFRYQPTGMLKVQKH